MSQRLQSPRWHHQRQCSRLQRGRVSCCNPAHFCCKPVCMQSKRYEYYSLRRQQGRSGSRNGTGACSRGAASLPPPSSCAWRLRPRSYRTRTRHGPFLSASPSAGDPACASGVVKQPRRHVHAHAGVIRRRRRLLHQQRRRGRARRGGWGGRLAGQRHQPRRWVSCCHRLEPSRCMLWTPCEVGDHSHAWQIPEFIMLRATHTPVCNPRRPSAPADYSRTFMRLACHYLESKSIHPIDASEVPSGNGRCHRARHLVGCILRHQDRLGGGAERGPRAG